MYGVSKEHIYLYFTQSHDTWVHVAKIKQLLPTVSTSQAYPFLPLFPCVDEINIMPMSPKERIIIKKNLEESRSIKV